LRGMRILVLHEYNRSYGGGEQYLHDTCAALREMGHRIALVCVEEWNGGFIPSDQTYGVAHSVGLRMGLRLWPEYESILQREQPHVVYINGILRHFVSPLILGRVIQRCPSVLFVHHSGLFCHNAMKVLATSQRRCEWPLGFHCFQEGCVSALEGSAYARLRTAVLGMWRARALRGCRRVIAPSQYVSRELVWNGFPPGRVRVLPSFTCRTPVHPVGAEGPQILWVGRADGGKGLDQFLRCLTMLRGVAWQAIIVGDGTATPQVQAMAMETGVADRVRCVGRLEGAVLDREYAAARVVVFTSQWAETFGQVGIEAMAFGKPVVAFDVGGVREWLADGRTGYVVDRDDLPGMTDRLSRLLADDELCARMGAAGRAAVESRFRNRHHVPALLEIFREAIRAPGSGPAEAAPADRAAAGN